MTKPIAEPEGIGKDKFNSRIFNEAEPGALRHELRVDELKRVGEIRPVFKLLPAD